MNHVQDCLSARNDRESSFHYCGSTVKLVQPCLAVSTAEEALLSTCRPI